MLSHFSVKKPYTVIVAVILIMILGVVSFLNISTDLLPSINLPYAVIITPYGGASPEEVELVVTRPIEQSMASISNIKSVSSISREHLSMVILEFNESTNMDSAFIEMRESLDMLRGMLPSAVGSSNIMKLNPDMMPVMVISAAVDGQDIAESSAFLERVIIPELESVEGVASVQVSGLIENEIHIFIDDEKIAEINSGIEALFSAMMMPGSVSEASIPKVSITKEMVSGILKGQNFSMPSGYITEDGVSYLVRTGDTYDSLESIQSTLLFTLPIEGMDPIRLEDVADIAVVNNSSDMYSKVNGTDAVTLTIQKQTEYVTSDLSKRLQARMTDIMSKHDDVRMVTLMDQGEYIDIVVNSLSLNLLFGGLLAVAVLFLFLRDLKPTLVVGLAIPISIITTFVLMYFSNITLNIISMGGLALGVGMLVDNSIVVIENIYRMRHEGKKAIEASIEGAKQVAGAIMASTLTTVAVFIPIVFVQGFTREIFTDMGLTIAYSLLASLIIALTFVPMMASKVLAQNVNKDHPIFERMKMHYGKLLRLALRHKAITIILVLAAFAGSLFGAMNMGTELFPAMDANELNATLEMPLGTQFSDLTQTADMVTSTLLTINGIESVGASVGGGMFGGFGGGSDTSVRYYITLDDKRSRDTHDIIQDIQSHVLSTDYTFTVSSMDMNMGGLSGSPISIQIKGQDFDTLESIANDIAQRVSSVPGTVDVSSGIEETEPELRITVDKDKSITKGLTVAQVFMEVNSALAKSSASTQLSTLSGNIDIYVFDAQDLVELTQDDLLNLTITSPQGDAVVLSDIASLAPASGFKSINRSNQQRYVTVTASLQDGYNIGKVSADVESAIADYPVPLGFSIEMAGENETINSSFADLSLMLLLGVVFIYLIMVAQFQSLLSPFIVMFTIPLAFTGGFLGLILVGMPLSIVAFIGLIILSGVVVNNGIVFVDYANKMRESGLSTHDALIKTGTDRLRPILMTAITTIIALSTMSLGAGTGTEMMQPMAITAIGGLIYATLLTLILIPVLYDVMHHQSPA